MPDFTELIRRYAEHSDQAAFAELVRGHANLVYSVALRQVAGDAHLAEEVVQEVFLVLARKAAGLTGRATLNGWLYHAAILEANAAIRREQRRRAREQRAQREGTIMDPQNSTGSGEPDWETARPSLDQAINQLTDRERDAILLRYFENRTFPEIGRLLHVSEDGARMRVERALEKLRGRLNRRGLAASSAAGLAALLSSQAGMAAPPALIASVTGAVLASAGATVPALSFITLMSTTKLAAGAVAVALLLALGTATYEVRASRQAESALAAANQSYDTLADQARQLSRRARTATAALPSGPGASERGTDGATTNGAPDPLAAGRAFLEAHPGLADKTVAYQRANLAAQYGELFNSLGLNPTQISQFEDIMMQGRPPAVNGMQLPISPIQASSGEIQSQLQMLLGDTNFAQYQQFTTAIPARALVSQLASAVYYSDSPLTAGQADQLTQFYVQGVASGQNRAQATGALLGQAQAILTPVQVAALTSVVQQQQAQTAFTKALRSPQSVDANATKPSVH